MFLYEEKLVALSDAARLSKKFREEGKHIATVNGSFDLFHVGHLNVLERASRQADVLFIGVNSDESVRSGKGPARPFVPERARAAVIAGLACTTYVSIIDGDYSEAQNTFIRAIRPHVHVNDSAYGPPETWLEWPVLQELHIEAYACPRTEGISTSELIEKLRTEATG